MTVVLYSRPKCVKVEDYILVSQEREIYNAT